MRSIRSRVAVAVLIALCAPVALPGSVAVAATPGAPVVSAHLSTSTILPGGTATLTAAITATPCTPGIDCVSWTDSSTGATEYETDTICSVTVSLGYPGPSVPVTVTGGALGSSVVDVSAEIPADDLKPGPNNVVVKATQSCDLADQWGGVVGFGGAQLDYAGRVGIVGEVTGTVTITHADGSSTTAVAGTPILWGDVVDTSSDSAVVLGFLDGTQIDCDSDCRLVVNDYRYDAETGSGSSFFSLLKGVFLWTSGLIGKNNPGNETINTGFTASLGIRGTEFILRYDPNTASGELDLGSGSVAVTPFGTRVSTTFDASQTIRFNYFGIQSADPLTQASYDLQKQAILSRFDPGPSADAGGPYSANEGAATPITGTAADTDGDAVATTWTYSVVSADAGATCVFGDAAALATTVTCTDNGTFKLTLSADDGVNPPVTSDATLTVANVNPVVSLSAPLSGAVYAIGSSVALTAPFSDAGTNDTHSCAIDWGDGSGPQAGAVSDTLGSGVCSGAMSFVAPGIYTIQVAITDDNGGVGSASAQVVVYDPSAGFVTGSGWIDSPSGAHVEHPSLSGKATFGFMSGYQKGASVPTGQTEFEFQTGSLDFHSAGYQWLVVNQHGTRALFKGTGTINGAGAYDFMIWAGDGSPDTFRIQITDPNNGDAVVYDNGVQQALGGGSIAIHTN